MRHVRCCQQKLPHNPRRYAANDLAALGLDQGELRLREGLQWQRSVVDLLVGYVAAVDNVFGALVQAHVALDEKLLSTADAPMAKPLLAAVRTAHAVIRETVEATHGQLEARRDTLTAWATSVAEADFAAAEVRRYTAKLEVLSDEDAELRSRGKASPAKAEARLQRNREKLQGAEEAAARARTRSRDSLRDGLCKLASKVLTGTAGALHCCVGRLPPVEASAAATAGLTARLKGDPTNPFGLGHGRQAPEHLSRPSQSTAAQSQSVDAPLRSAAEEDPARGGARDREECGRRGSAAGEPADSRLLGLGTNPFDTDVAQPESSLDLQARREVRASADTTKSPRRPGSCGGCFGWLWPGRRMQAPAGAVAGPDRKDAIEDFAGS
eukprot:CAMPEP_0168407826 /NCGR_PEP_ID=MMETSP0228-20121227/26360_1 /TAXON_ID=133427 /ORGANISM="Protoceratium reticulatum, Strain CCCM 535 (=CCMP 1889)" /LENGTH=382 /DNA_ID=CAMNT_0008421503 /DNA_START=16 /DNA_END=1165 /DNA_ORIENTATION=+